MDESPRRQAKVWSLKPHDRTAIETLSRTLRVSPIVAQLLLNRQLSEAEAAQRFLACPMSGLYEPELLPGMDEAAARLLAAVSDKRRICVYGDYDVDGVAATAILLNTLRCLDANVKFHVPHRLDDGYGLNSETLQKLAAEGVQLVVTVDC